MKSKTLKQLLIGELSWKRVVRSTALILLSVYAVLFVYGYFFGDRLIFQPQPSSYTDTEHILKVTMPDGSVISARSLFHPSASYTILYSHGNAEDLGDIEEIIHQFYAHGFSIIAYDYNGYGTSPGVPSEQAVYANILAVYEFVTQELRRHPEDILIVGRSIGGGPSVHLAAQKTVGGLILESSFTSAFRVLTKTPLFPFDKFDNLRKIPSVSCPVLIIHGKQDETIPFWHGELLYERARSPKMMLWVDEAHHDDVVWVAGEQYWTAIEQFLHLINK